MQETWVQTLHYENPLEKGVDTHSSNLTQKILQTEEPGGLYSLWSCKELDTTEQLTHIHTQQNECVSKMQSWMRLFKHQSKLNDNMSVLKCILYLHYTTVILFKSVYQLSLRRCLYEEGKLGWGWQVRIEDDYRIQNQGMINSIQSLKNEKWVTCIFIICIPSESLEPLQDMFKEFCLYPQS